MLNKKLKNKDRRRHRRLRFCFLLRTGFHIISRSNL